MVWNRKGKFGLHTGRTLRRHPTLKSYYCNGRASKDCHEYAVVKELKFKDPTRRLSFDKSSVKLGVNDGELSFDESTRGWYWPVSYSLNKHKRWLLPDLMKERVEQRYWEEVAESEEHSKLTKPCARKAVQKDTSKVHVTVVERYAANNIDSRQPDCFEVTSSRPDCNSSKPQRKSRAKFAYVGDLRPKFCTEDDDDVVEVCYEFLSPFPKECWPHGRQLGRLYKRSYRDEVSGSKSLKKCKGRRNKQCPIMENDSDCLANAKPQERKDCSYLESRSYSFPIGSYIDDLLKFGKRNERNSCLSVNNNLVVSSPNPLLYGKGDAIYVEKEDQEFSRADIETTLERNQAVTVTEPLIVDRKVKCTVLVDDIAPGDLLQQFGCNYIEENISPRKFIIKADLSDALPNVCDDIPECCMLFEVAADTSSNVIEVDVTTSIPNDDIMPRNLVEILKSDLKSLSCVGPLTVKALVVQTMEKISSVVQRLPRSNCSVKTSARSIARVPVEFIHNVCERKPEICGMKDAVRYSMPEKIRPKDLPSLRVNDYECDDVYCDICYIEEDGQQEIDFTSLLKCLHRVCNDCWTSYIMSCIGLGQSSITCPYFTCQTVIGEAMVWSLTNSDNYRRYSKLKRQLAIDVNQEFRHCPAADCTQMAYVNSSTKKESSIAMPILCNCGQMWCFGCQRDAHWPASCEEARLFREKCDDYESIRQMYHLPGRISSVQVKRCPFCSHPIEKKVGCQHMLCRCGNDFCWECLCPWEGHNWDTCDEKRKDLEDVELLFEFGNARFKKYSKVALDNIMARTGKRFGVFRRRVKGAKQLADGNKSVSFNLETSASRRLKKYTAKSFGSVLEQIFHFKYLAHLVLENTAAALAVTKTKNMLKTLDKNMRMLDFIVWRLSEIFSKPEALSDEACLNNVEAMLIQGEKLIRNIHIYTRTRRNNVIKFVH